MTTAKMTLDEYQNLAAKTAVYPSSFALVYPIVGLASEAGELAGKLKRCMRDAGGDVTEEARQQMIRELGDVLWYVAAVAADLETTLTNVAAVNLEKLARRLETDTLKGEGDDREEAHAPAGSAQPADPGASEFGDTSGDFDEEL